MKTFIIGLSLVAALAAPLGASAQTQPEGASLPAGHYLIVDAQSGRTVGQLVAVNAPARDLRTIGFVTTQGASAAAAPVPLFPHIDTVGQSFEEYMAAFREQFHMFPSP